MASFLSSVGRFCARRRGFVVLAWVILLIAIALVAKASGGKTIDNFTVPGTQSQQAADLLAVRIPSLAGASTQVVFEAKKGMTIAMDKCAWSKKSF